MGNSIYSLVLSDNVVDAVDTLAHSSGLSRSAMINRILAERVALTTPEMRLRLRYVRAAEEKRAKSAFRSGRRTRS